MILVFRVARAPRPPRYVLALAPTRHRIDHTDPCVAPFPPTCYGNHYEGSGTVTPSNSIEVLIQQFRQRRTALHGAEAALE